MKRNSMQLIYLANLLVITSLFAALKTSAWTVGEIDLSFSIPEPNGTIYALKQQPNGKWLIGGTFTNLNEFSRGRIARLNSDGQIDTSFLPTASGANNVVRCLDIQPDGKILIGGDFTSVNGSDRGRIARLNQDGSMDSSFQNGLSGAGARVACLKVQGDGKILIGGDFATVNGANRIRIARLNPDGSLDTSFVFSAGTWQGPLNSTVESIELQIDGKILVGGAFGLVGGIGTRSGIARLTTNGSLDSTFQNNLAGANSTVHCVKLQTDGKIMIGGQFSLVNGQARAGVARINSDGSLDTSFQNGMSGVRSGVNGMYYGDVKTLSLQVDGKIIIGGDFRSINDTAAYSVGRLNADGSLDTSFQQGISGTDCSVYASAAQSDSKIVIGGCFFRVHVFTTKETSRKYLARFFGEIPPDVLGISLRKSGDSLVISWPSVVGATYRLQYTDSLSAINWIELPQDITTSSSSFSVTNAITTEPRYYRVRKLN